jgi:hypothetical protein
MRAIDSTPKPAKTPRVTQAQIADQSRQHSIKIMARLLGLEAAIGDLKRETAQIRSIVTWSFWTLSALFLVVLVGTFSSRLDSQHEQPRPVPTANNPANKPANGQQ